MVYNGESIDTELMSDAFVYGELFSKQILEANDIAEKELLESALAEVKKHSRNKHRDESDGWLQEERYAIALGCVDYLNGKIEMLEQYKNQFQDVAKKIAVRRNSHVMPQLHQMAMDENELFNS